MIDTQSEGANTLMTSHELTIVGYGRTTTDALGAAVGKAAYLTVGDRLDWVLVRATYVREDEYADIGYENDLSCTAVFMGMEDPALTSLTTS